MSLKKWNGNQIRRRGKAYIKILVFDKMTLYKNLYREITSHLQNA